MKINYIKSLDGLRFLAVALVLVDHWSGDALGFPASYLGVCLFFVLSGFLISRILLVAKDKDELAQRGHGFSLRQFYIRRTIRIFPLYYLCLAVLFLLNIAPVREEILWLVTYMSNNKIALNSQWMGVVDHLWSLAVEEQFYLFFPFLVLFLNKKHLVKSFVGMILLALILRMSIYVSGASWIKAYVLMPACLDAFGIGALLAWVSLYPQNKIIAFIGSARTFLLGLLVYLSVVWVLNFTGGGHNAVAVVWLRLAESIFSVSLIAYLIHGKSDTLFKNIFEWKPFVYIGKISYGVYIFHNFVYNHYHTIPGNPINKIVAALAENKNPFIASAAFKIVVLFAITVALASASWYLFEKPINQLKNKYGY